MGFPGGSDVKNLPAIQETQVQSLGQEDPLEKEMVTHSNILVWIIPRAEELGRLQCHKELDTTEKLTHLLLSLSRGMLAKTHFLNVK